MRPRRDVVGPDAVTVHEADAERMRGSFPGTVLDAGELERPCLDDRFRYGLLLLTNRRLLHLGVGVLTTIELGEIDEAVCSGGQLLLSLAGGRGAMLRVNDPCQLRAFISAARRDLISESQAIER